MAVERQKLAVGVVVILSILSSSFISYFFILLGVEFGGGIGWLTHKAESFIALWGIIWGAFCGCIAAIFLIMALTKKLDVKKGQFYGLWCGLAVGSANGLLTGTLIPGIIIGLLLGPPVGLKLATIFISMTRKEKEN